MRDEYTAWFHHALGTAEDWRHGSLHVRRHGPAELKRLLSDWPVKRPRNWVDHLNRPHTPRQTAAIANAIERGCPLRSDERIANTAKRYDLLSTLRPRGRPVGWQKRAEKRN